MIKCPQCGEENVTGLRHCIVCGHEFIIPPSTGDKIHIEKFESKTLHEKTIPFSDLPPEFQTLTRQIEIYQIENRSDGREAIYLKTKDGKEYHCKSIDELPAELQREVEKLRKLSLPQGPVKGTTKIFNSFNDMPPELRLKIKNMPDNPQIPTIIHQNKKAWTCSFILGTGLLVITGIFLFLLILFE